MGATQTPSQPETGLVEYEVTLIILGCVFGVLLGCLALAALAFHAAIIPVILCAIISSLRTLAHLSCGKAGSVTGAIRIGIQCVLETLGMLFVSFFAALFAFVFAFALLYALVALSSGEDRVIAVELWFGLAVAFLVLVFVFSKLTPGRIFSAGPIFDPPGSDHKKNP